ncbi:MAG: MFS transporter [Acidobacteria bacterium]|nr:MFS transporter [Acidobacteriota bacterium]
MGTPENSQATAAGETVPAGRGSSFAALRHRDFRLMWLGQFFSLTGSQMQLVTINWHVYILTRPHGEAAAAAALGLVGLVRVLPIVVCSLVGGVVADAADRKRLIVVTQAVMLLSAAALAAFTASGLEQVWPVYALTALSSAAVAFDNPARQALLPIFARDVLMVGEQGYGLLAAASAAGAVVTGLLLARRGSRWRRPGLAVLVSVAVYGAATVGFGLSRSYRLSLLMLALAGAADTVSTVIRQTIRQLITPDRLRGRMTSVNMIFFMGGPQLGELEAGLLAAAMGAPFSVVLRHTEGY